MLPEDTRSRSASYPTLDWEVLFRSRFKGITPSSAFGYGYHVVCTLSNVQEYKMVKPLLG